MTRRDDPPMLYVLDAINAPSKRDRRIRAVMVLASCAVAAWVVWKIVWGWV